jgi:hypothetical protein
MKTKTPRRCGHCATADAVRGGTRYGRKVDGVIHYLSRADALAHLASLCRCPDRESTETLPTFEEVPEIRRPGQRILKPGVNVAVQLKKSPGTKRTLGHVVACYADGTVAVRSGVREIRVDADEWLVARRGVTK